MLDKISRIVKDRSSFAISTIYEYMDDRRTPIRKIQRGKSKLYETYVILDEIRNYVMKYSRN